MLEQVKALFGKTLSTYQIAKETGLPEQTVRDLRNGKTQLEDARYRTIKALHDYYVSKWSMKTYDVIEIDWNDVEDIEVIESGEIEIQKLNGLIYAVYDEKNESTYCFATYEQAKEYAEQLMI